MMHLNELNSPNLQPNKTRNVVQNHKPLLSVLQTQLEAIQLHLAAVEHVQIDQILHGKPMELINSLQVVHKQMVQQLHSLYRSVLLCGESPLQGAVHEVVDAVYEQVDHDSQVARAVRTTRHTIRVLNLFQRTLKFYLTYQQ